VGDASSRLAELRPLRLYEPPVVPATLRPSSLASTRLFEPSFAVVDLRSSAVLRKARDGGWEVLLSSRSAGLGDKWPEGEGEGESEACAGVTRKTVLNSSKQSEAGRGD
jgi:hypothetical protein